MAHLTVILQPDAPVSGGVAEVADWPLHVTLVQAFRVEARAERVVQLIDDRLRRFEPLLVTGAAIEDFGPDADIEVTVLEHSAPLVEEHLELLADLASLPRFEPDAPAYSGSGYRPHVTACTSGSLPVGARMRLAWAAVVDMDSGPVVLSAHLLGASR